MNSTPNLFFHFGTHKTGSTAIQKWLKQNRPLLEKHGFAFVQGGTGVCGRLTTAKDDKEAQAKEILSFRAKMQAAEPLAAVVSAEGFSGHYLDAYAEHERYAEFVARLSEGFQARYVVYLRRQDQFIESAYTQSVHRGRSWSFAEFLEHAGRENFDWERFLRPYEKLLGEKNLIVRPYEPAAFERGVVHDFLAAIGAPSGLLDAVLEDAGQWKNQSFGRTALEIARMCYPSLDDRGRRSLRRILQRYGPKQRGKEHAYFDPEERDQLLACHAGSNARVAQKYLGRTTLFSETERKTPGGPDFEIGMEETAAILFRALVAIKHRQEEIEQHIRDSWSYRLRNAIARLMGRQGPGL